MLFDSRFKVVFDQSVQQYAENLPWILIGLAILLGTAIVVLLVIYLGDCCVGGSLKRPWTNFTKKHDHNMRRSRRSYGRLAIILLAVSIFAINDTCLSPHRHEPL